MPTQLTTRAQVNGYRFLLRRFEHALVRREVRMLHDPMAVQFRSLVIGLVLGILVIAGCGVLALLHPQGEVGQATIVMGSDSGAVYAVVDGTLHPALNLASARLITNSNASPTSVKDSKLASMPRGPILGIPGAPAALPGSADAGHSVWTLCDTVGDMAGVQTAALAGPVHLGPAARPLGPGEALLASVDGVTYLVYNGKHARVDMSSKAIESELHLSGRKPRAMSAGLLDATVVAPDLAPPLIPFAGSAGSVRAGSSTLPIGSIIEVSNINSSTLYVVLSQGIQPVSAFTADVIRSANSVGIAGITSVPLDSISGVPVVNSLPVDQFPSAPPTLLAAQDDPVTCLSWSRAGAAPAALTVLVGQQLPLPDGAKPVTMADTSGDHVCVAYVPPSSGEYVQVTGIEADSGRRDSLFYIADTGVRYGIPDTATGNVLNLGTPKPAPWQIVDQFVAGPMLSREAALVEHDTLPAAAQNH